MQFQEFALETIIVECNFKNLLWKQLLLNAISRIYSGNNYSWMQPQEFALETIIVERNFKNATIKKRTFQLMGPSSCIKPCSEKLHQLIDKKMMKRNCAAYGSYYNVSTQSFLWRKLFHRVSQAFIFLPENVSITLPRCDS